MTEAFIEPYAEIFEHGDSRNGIFTPLYHRLPEGVHTFVVTWSGVQLLRVFRSHAATSSARVEIGRISSGEGRRTLTIPGVGVEAGETAFLALTTSSAEEAGQRATVQIVTTPLKKAQGEEDD